MARYPQVPARISVGLRSLACCQGRHTKDIVQTSILPLFPGTFLIGITNQQGCREGHFAKDHLLVTDVHLAPARWPRGAMLAGKPPSRTSATVIWIAYLCMGAGVPNRSVATTTSWAKFFGTPPPNITRPVSPKCNFNWVSSTKSFAESMLTFGPSPGGPDAAGAQSPPSNH